MISYVGVLLGLVRPLSLQELYLATTVANTPTSASFVKYACSPFAIRRFFRDLPAAAVDTRGVMIVKHQHSPKPTLSQAEVTIQLLEQPKGVRKRALEDDLDPDPVALPAHLDPVYGYTNPDFDMVSELQMVRNHVKHGFSERTTKVEQGHWKKWRTFARPRGLRLWRDDHAANEGRDKPGYQREVDILAAFLLHCLKTMKSNKKRPAALPQSAANVLRGLRRIHKKRSPPIHMVPIAAVLPVLKSLTKKYIRRHGYRMLLPRRREPWRQQHLKAMFTMRKANNLVLGGIKVTRSVFWTAYFAFQETLSQCGMRSSEALVHKPSDWHPSDHLSRASLLWSIRDKIIVSPTPQQLNSLTQHDYAIVIPPPSKTDAFGVIWGDKPIYLPVRFDAPWCAALRLRDLELQLPLSGSERATSPLFCDEDRFPILYSTAYKILEDQKRLVMSDEFDKSLYTFHSFRVYLATTLAAAGCSDPEIQALCRWQTAESLRIYKRFQPESVCSMLDRAQHAKVSSYTAANLPTISSYQVAAGIHAWNNNAGTEEE